ncbi:hypothetical protein [Flavobacterium sp.]|uniref:hypothetical protein n=1 Tax=Flavobacterium sp. TaxID=239 RepID=UPI002608B6A5|nr:hypothetical protein [Flavobacterium sp.]
MKSITSLCLLLFVLFSACKDDDKTHQLEITKALKERELVFNTLNKTWNFTPKRLSPESQAIENNWNEWRLFVSELDQKPKATIGAFQRKTKMLVQKATLLESTIPARIDKPQIKSRLSAMITKVKALHTFLNLDRIPEKKVVELITDLNIEVIAIQDQIDEIVRRSHIQKEEGEQEMLNSIGGGANMSETVKPVETPKEIEEQGILK